jgi:hypothetical protein
VAIVLIFGQKSVAKAAVHLEKANQISGNRNEHSSKIPLLENADTGGKTKSISVRGLGAVGAFGEGHTNARRVSSSVSYTPVSSRIRVSSSIESLSRGGVCGNVGCDKAAGSCVKGSSSVDASAEAVNLLVLLNQSI